MARGKGGLGRGLDSLFEDAAPVFESGAKVDTLPLREIEPDPEQPRKTFDEETLGELAASIAEHGLLQPIAVRPRPRGGYSIVAGERRWRHRQPARCHPGSLPNPHSVPGDPHHRRTVPHLDEKQKGIAPFRPDERQASC